MNYNLVLIFFILFIILILITCGESDIALLITITVLIFSVPLMNKMQQKFVGQQKFVKQQKQSFINNDPFGLDTVNTLGDPPGFNDIENWYVAAQQPSNFSTKKNKQKSSLIAGPGVAPYIQDEVHPPAGSMENPTSYPGSTNLPIVTVEPDGTKMTNSLSGAYGIAPKTILYTSKITEDQLVPYDNAELVDKMFGPPDNGLDRTDIYSYKWENDEEPDLRFATEDLASGQKAQRSILYRAKFDADCCRNEFEAELEEHDAAIWHEIDEQNDRYPFNT